MDTGVGPPVDVAVPGGTDVGVAAGGSVASRAAVVGGVDVGGKEVVAGTAGTAAGVEVLAGGA